METASLLVSPLPYIPSSWKEIGEIVAVCQQKRSSGPDSPSSLDHQFLLQLLRNRDLEQIDILVMVAHIEQDSVARFELARRCWSAAHRLCFPPPA